MTLFTSSPPTHHQPDVHQQIQQLSQKILARKRRGLNFTTGLLRDRLAQLLSHEELWGHDSPAGIQRLGDGWE